jgi:DNA-binding MltR family transcriptional regulator
MKSLLCECFGSTVWRRSRKRRFMENLISANVNAETVQSAVRPFLSLVNESDRGCVLLITTHLDDALGALHKGYIKATISASTRLLNDLFRPYAPLSTFRARIQIGYSYGLIPVEDYRDLELIRTLRNDAAHSSTDFSFGDAKLQEQVLRLHGPHRIQELLPELLEAFNEEQRRRIRSPGRNPASIKLYFILSGLCLHVSILTRLVGITNQGRS